MSSQPLDRTHPVTEFASRLCARMDQLAETSTWTMTPAEQRTTLIQLAQAEAQLARLRLQVLHDAERTGATTEKAAPTSADWLAIETRQTRLATRSDLKLAKTLDHHPALSTAMAHGAVNQEQARVIVKALDRLPTTGEFAVDPDQRERAEHYLVEQAAHYDAKKLDILGRGLFEVIAPEIAEQIEGRQLEKQEAAALRRTFLNLREDGEGTCHGRFRIPALHGQILRKLLNSLTNPVRSTTTDIDSQLPTEVRQGLAFAQLLEAIPGNCLPKAGGVSATIVVTMTLDQLTAALDTAGVCTLDTGTRISAADARRLACSAGIIPAVLGGKSQVLDLGRKRRLHTETQRIALGLRDRGCTEADCQMPPSMCHAHHDIPWSQGGPTDLTHGRLLCGHHHRRIHDPRYTVTRHPTGTVSFHRRT